MVVKALEKISALCPHQEAMENMTTYDPDFALVVLAAAAKVFPRRIDFAGIKHAINPEPSDDALFTAINALEADRYIEAKVLRDNRHQIKSVAYISTTREGREQLKLDSSQSTSRDATVIHHQVNTYGPVGAVGTNSHGIVNIHNQPTNLQHVDLQVLAVELEELRKAYKKTAQSREDDKQIALIGDATEAAEKGDRQGVSALLSKIAKPVMDKAVEIGTDLVAKTIAEVLKSK